MDASGRQGGVDRHDETRRADSAEDGVKGYHHSGEAERGWKMSLSDGVERVHIDDLFANRFLFDTCCCAGFLV